MRKYYVTEHHSAHLTCESINDSLFTCIQLTSKHERQGKQTKHNKIDENSHALMVERTREMPNVVPADKEHRRRNYDVFMGFTMNSVKLAFDWCNGIC